MASACVAIQFGAAGVARSDSKIKVEARAGKADSAGKQTIRVTIDIAKGWHIFANPVKNEDYDANKTVVEVRSGGKMVAAKVSYPDGKVLDVPKIGKMQVYEGRVTIDALVDAVQGPMEISVRVNACNDNKCLPEGTAKLTVP